MSLGSSLDAKEQVREAIDVVDLVGKYVQLRRQGRGYVGLCPWHDDTRPSLQVNPERQSFKCWVCDIGGDVFSFVMKMEGVGFPEALAMLADQAGIALRPYRPTGRGASMGPAGAEGGASGAPTAPEQVTAEGKRALYRAMAWAEKQYHECLLEAPEGDPARRYLQERGITSESIQKWHLGFSPGGDWILRQARGTQFRAEMLEAIGVLARSADGARYDRFRGRLLFSIRDPQDRPVGIGGRVLPGVSDSSRAKYVNSPETPLFTKSKLLYGLDIARHAMRKSRTALVMEGYTDCIVAHQYGFEDAVAVLGTALTERHVRTLSPFADRIVLVLDGDEAGQRRANEVLELFVAAQVDLRVLTLPEESDPADFLEEHGAEAFRDLLADRAVDALEHAYQAKTHGVDLDRDVHAASRVLEEMVSIVAKAPRLRHDTTHEHRFREQKILERLAFRFRVSERVVRDRLTALRRAARRRAASGQSGTSAPPEAAAAKPARTVGPWERELLEILIGHPECLGAVRAEIPPEQVAPGPCREIYETCCRLSDAGQRADFDRLILQFDDPAIKSLLVQLDEEAQNKAAVDPESLLKELFLRRKTHAEDPTQLAAFRDEGLERRDKEQMLRNMVRELRARHGISDPTDG